MNLREADLIGTNLGGADLRGANLSGANLSGADLIGANLSFVTNLTGTILTGVEVDSGFPWRSAVEQGALCRDPDTDELMRFEAPTDGEAPEICRRL